MYCLLVETRTTVPSSLSNKKQDANHLNCIKNIHFYLLSNIIWRLFLTYNFNMFVISYENVNSEE
jgi:hypothetical protein